MNTIQSSIPAIEKLDDIFFKFVRLKRNSYCYHLPIPRRYTLPIQYTQCLYRMRYLNSVKWCRVCRAPFFFSFFCCSSIGSDNKSQYDWSDHRQRNGFGAVRWKESIDLWFIILLNEKLLISCVLPANDDKLN